MRKRLVSLLLCLCMAATLLPVTVMAADPGEYLLDGDNVFMNGASNIIVEGQDGTDSDTNLKITYTNKSGQTKTLLYKGKAARVHAGYKHPGTLGVDTSKDYYTITVKSGKLQDVLIGSKGRTDPNANTLTMVGGTINVEGGDIDTVAAAWYYCQSMTGTVTINISGGTIDTVYGGGETNYEASVEVQEHINSSMGADAFHFVPTYNNVDINISGGTIGNVYGGGRVLTQHATSADYSMVTKNVTIDVTGGTINDLYGGGFSGPNDNWGEDSGQDTYVTEKTSVTVSGGTVSRVFGGGYNGQWKWLHKMDASGNLVVSNYNGEKTIPIARNIVQDATVNIKDGAKITTGVYAGGGSYAHVDKTVVNMTGGETAVLSTSGTYGYVVSSAANVSGGQIDKLELLTRNYVGDIDVDVTGGTVTEFYAGVGGAYKNGNCNETAYNISTMDILGDVNVSFASGAEPESAYLTTGLEQAKSVSISIPVQIKNMSLVGGDYNGDETASGNFAIENDDAQWDVTVDARDEDVSFSVGTNTGAADSLVILDTVAPGAEDIAVTGVALDKTALDLEAGGSEALSATISPADATNQTLLWFSSNTNVATVDQTGQVTAVGGGMATITVVTREGNFSHSCTITVPEPVTEKPADGVPVFPGIFDAPPFDDVGYFDWFYEEVMYVYASGLMAGTGYRTFAPHAPLTRAMVWTVLARMDGVNTGIGSLWYAAGQAWAMKNGISDGTAPMSPITREQLAAMLMRYAAYKGYSTSVSADLSRFTDASTISGYATAPMQWAVGQGIIGGSGNKLNPQGNATRAEAAAMLMRFRQSV